jgi:hypothetical protein
MYLCVGLCVQMYYYNLTKLSQKNNKSKEMSKFFKFLCAYSAELMWKSSVSPALLSVIFVM